jgi:hypothetical protein
VSKLVGSEPSVILRDSNIDASNFVRDKTLNEAHQKLFYRIDNLVESEKLEIEALRETKYDCSDLKDPVFRDLEERTLYKCAPVENVYRKH